MFEIQKVEWNEMDCGALVQGGSRKEAWLQKKFVSSELRKGVKIKKIYLYIAGIDIG